MADGIGPETNPSGTEPIEDWRWGTVAAKRLPNGRVLTVTPMTFGKYRLNVGSQFCDLSYDDSW